jgi:hypothetical protein
MVADATNTWSFFYFFIVTFSCSFFALDLTLAVLITVFSETDEKDSKAYGKHSDQIKKRSVTARSSEMEFRKRKTIFLDRELTQLISQQDHDLDDFIPPEDVNVSSLEDDLGEEAAEYVPILSNIADDVTKVLSQSGLFDENLMQRTPFGWAAKCDIKASENNLVEPSNGIENAALSSDWLFTPRLASLGNLKKPFARSMTAQELFSPSQQDILSPFTLNSSIAQYNKSSRSMLRSRTVLIPRYSSLRGKSEREWLAIETNVMQKIANAKEFNTGLEHVQLRNNIAVRDAGREHHLYARRAIQAVDQEYKAQSPEGKCTF